MRLLCRKNDELAGAQDFARPSNYGGGRVRMHDVWVSGIVVDRCRLEFQDIA